MFNYEGFDVRCVSFGGVSTVNIGTVETVEPDVPAEITNSGTKSHAVLNFKIPKGEAGQNGAPGEPGSPGTPGSPGADGQDGEDGKSAYELAVEAGYEGTEEEFSEELAAAANKLDKPATAGTDGQVLTSDGEGGQEWRDPTGGSGSNEVWLPTVDASGNISWQKSSSSTAPTTRNIRGPQGIQGLPGEDGQDGAPGAPGSPGTPGANGYTPVRGTDYWTAEDIATIKGYVDDAILNGEW